MSFIIPKLWKKNKTTTTTNSASNTGSTSSYISNPTTSTLTSSTSTSNSSASANRRSSQFVIHNNTEPNTGPRPQPGKISTSPTHIASSSTPAPPAYAPTSPIDGFRDISGEDPLEVLREYDTVFLIDDSSSMKGKRWTEARTSLMGVADIAARYDQDGIDVQFLNSKKDGNGLRTGNQVMQLFESVKPNGATPTGQRLENILREYMISLEKSSKGSNRNSMMFGRNYPSVVKPMNLIVITDGAPTDDPESVIVTFAKRLDKGEYPLSQIGIQFLQVGDDPSAREALQELDDELSDKHDIRDMVDTVPYCGKELTADIIVKTLIGGINRRMDRKAQV